MQYIAQPGSGTIDFDRYLRYLETVRDRLSEDAWRFASDPRHHDLRSPQTLHDAWLDRIAICEDASGDRREIRRLRIDVEMLGAFHDRRIRLGYTGVHAYRFDVPAAVGARFERVAHGDLIAHELRAREGGGIVHELMFERRGTFVVECDAISHVQEMITDSSAV